MLPPIGAALSASVDYRDPGRQAIPASLATTGIAATVPPLPANLLGGGRIDILSLSGQMQLAQGLSIFAETIGSFLKISRREGEGLVDYANRLADVLKSLSPSQRAALEQIITQIVRGITLRVLTEILQNPLGPEAARLTAQLESAPAADRDPAARAVVSSYRQNDATAASSASSASPVIRTPAMAAGPAPGPVLAKAPAGEPGLAPATAAHTGGTGASPAGGLTLTTDAVTTAPSRHAVLANADAVDEPRLPSSRTQGPPQPHMRGSTPPVPADAPDGDRASRLGRLADVQISGEARSGRSPPAQTSLLSNRGEAAGEPRLARGSISGTPVIYDAPALARSALRAVEDSKSRLIQEVLFQNPVSGSPSSENAGARKALVTQAVPARHQREQSAEESSIHAFRPSTATPLLQSGDATAARPSDIESMPPATAQAPVTKVAANLPAAAHLLVDPAAYILAAPMLAREGLNQVLMTYPPTSPAPDEEERDVERVSAIDEDGDRRSSHQDAQGREDDPADDPSADDEDESGPGDAPADHAQDLYWRMADLT